MQKWQSNHSKHLKFNNFMYFEFFFIVLLLVSKKYTLIVHKPNKYAISCKKMCIKSPDWTKGKRNLIGHNPRIQHFSKLHKHGNKIQPFKIVDFKDKWKLND